GILIRLSITSFVVYVSTLCTEGREKIARGSFVSFEYSISYVDSNSPSSSSGLLRLFLHASSASKPLMMQSSLQSSGRSPGGTVGQLFSFLQASMTALPMASQMPLHNFSLLICGFSSQRKVGITLGNSRP